VLDGFHLGLRLIAEQLHGGAEAGASGPSVTTTPMSLGINHAMTFSKRSRFVARCAPGRRDRGPPKVAEVGDKAPASLSRDPRGLPAGGCPSSLDRHQIGDRG
jgi:hypothetical protein